ncbi:MAG TPA: carboxypeptidase-like regulatory domain-containing protein [Geminicoccaceae bacterium]|nr:carboxypeptidase-like regulatory domain-containing protein [Geminicoccaceae bacterium]
MRPWLVNRVTITFATIALVVLLWNLYVAQHDDGILAGTVTGPDGSPVPGAKVVLSERTIVSLDPIAETVTDDQGNFRFTGHDRHRVVLTASKPGVGQSRRLEVRLYFRNQNRELAEPLQLAP